MSLNREMETTVRSLAIAASARRQVLEHIRAETGRHLTQARTTRHRMTAEQQTLRSEALRSSHLATAMILGKADELVDEYRRQRIARTTELRRTLADGAKRLRARTRKWLSTETALRRKLATQSRRERLADRTVLQKAVDASRKRHREFLASLTKDRSAAAGTWRSHSVAVSAATPAAEEMPHRQHRQETESRAAAKRETEAKAAAKREAETKAVAKREAEIAAKREAEAKATPTGA